MTSTELRAEAAMARKRASQAAASARRLMAESKREAKRAASLAKRATAAAKREKSAAKRKPKRSAGKAGPNTFRRGKPVKVWAHDGQVWTLAGRAASLEAGRAMVKRLRSTGATRPIVLRPADQGAPIFPPPPSAM